MFEIEEFTTAKLLDVVVLSQKNRKPDENPGAKLKLEVSTSNGVLAYFDGHLKAFMFTHLGEGAPQGGLDGVDPVSDMPNLTKIGQKIGSLGWSDELTGYLLTVDLGLGGKRSNLEIADCKLSVWKITPKEGGTVVLRFAAESAHITEAQFGKLAKLKSRDIQITLLPPEPVQDPIE